MFADYETHEQLPAHTLREVKRFFEDYKTLENKEVVVGEPLDASTAVATIRASLKRYRQMRAQ